MRARDVVAFFCISGLMVFGGVAGRFLSQEFYRQRDGFESLLNHERRIFDHIEDLTKLKGLGRSSYEVYLRCEIEGDLARLLAYKKFIGRYYIGESRRNLLLKYFKSAVELGEIYSGKITNLSQAESCIGLIEPDLEKNGSEVR